MLDTFLYNGPLERAGDLQFIEMVAREQTAENCLLVLVTGGGSPDAAYKIGRYLQTKYNSLKILVPGICKSAGTLLAIAADELIFTPYGELGPLDVQMAKEDRVLGFESGLNISEAFITLEDRAKDTYHELVKEILTSTGHVVSFQTASHAATEIISGLYGPIFHRIDPEEVGSRSRAMRIGEDYGERLNGKWNNLKSKAIRHISQAYPSHSFVIDVNEASMLFNNVRVTNADEMKLIESLAMLGRFPQSTLTYRKLDFMKADNDEDQSHANQTPRSGRSSKRSEADAGDIGEAVARASAEAAS